MVHVLMRWYVTCAPDVSGRGLSQDGAYLQVMSLHGLVVTFVLGKIAHDLTPKSTQLRS